jgi:predicted PurR-regulated permease PerM
VAATGVLLLGLVAFLYFAKAFLLPAFLAVLFSFLLKPLVRGLCGLRIPKAIAAIIVLAFFISITGTALYTVNQPAKEWLSKTPESLNKLEMKARELLQEAENFIRRGRPRHDDGKPMPPPKNVLESVQLVSVANTVLSYTTSFLAGTLELLVLLYFLLAAGDTLLQRLVRVLPRLHEKNEAVAIVHQLEGTVSRYLVTITVVNAAHGLAVGTSAHWIGLPNPALWGVMAFLLNFIPYFGPLTGVVVLTLAGFLEFDSVGRALAPALAYLAIHTIESNLITPTVLGRRLTLNPIMIFLTLMFWTWLWGVPGALLATPLLMTFKILCDHIKPLAWIGEFLSG